MEKASSLKAAVVNLLIFACHYFYPVWNLRAKRGRINHVISNHEPHLLQSQCLWVSGWWLGLGTAFNTVNMGKAPEQLAWGWMPAAKRDFTQGSSEQTVWADSSAPSEPGMWGQHRDYLPVLRNVHVKLQQLRAKHILN